MEKRGKRQVPGTGEGRKALTKEGMSVAKNGMTSLHIETADSRNTLRRRPYTNPNAPWGTGQRVAQDKGGHKSPWGSQWLMRYLFQIVHLRSQGRSCGADACPWSSLCSEIEGLLQGCCVPQTSCSSLRGRDSPLVVPISRRFWWSPG